jgi:hypothetical protein
MTRAKQTAVRDALRAAPDGLTAVEVAAAVGHDASHINSTLKRMDDTYIDRWKPSRGSLGYAAVWCVADVPEDCPRPLTQKAKRGAV